MNHLWQYEITPCIDSYFWSRVMTSFPSFSSKNTLDTPFENIRPIDLCEFLRGCDDACCQIRRDSAEPYLSTAANCIYHWPPPPMITCTFNDWKAFNRKNLASWPHIWHILCGKWCLMGWKYLWFVSLFPPYQNDSKSIFSIIILSSIFS